MRLTSSHPLVACTWDNSAVAKLCSVDMLLIGISKSQLKVIIQKV